MPAPDEERRQGPPHGRRADDHHRTGWRSVLRENWYRDIWLVVISALLLLGYIGQNNVLDDVQRVQEEQREGRRAAIQVTCAATSAVIDAGRATITGGAESLDPEFAKNLEALGYPPINVRRDQARKAARLYAKAIADKVEAATGVEGVVHEKDGTLDCDLLLQLANTH